MTDRTAEIRTRIDVLKGAFMVCVAGDGTPYVKLQFKTLAEAQECHSLIATIPYLLDLIETLTSERDEWMAQIGKIAATVPIPSVLKVTGTTEDLIVWITDQVNRAQKAKHESDAKDAEIERLRSEIDAWQASFPGYCSGGES